MEDEENGREGREGRDKAGEEIEKDEVSEIRKGLEKVKREEKGGEKSGMRGG